MVVEEYMEKVEDILAKVAAEIIRQLRELDEMYDPFDHAASEPLRESASEALTDALARVAAEIAKDGDLRLHVWFGTGRGMAELRKSAEARSAGAHLVAVWRDGSATAAKMDDLCEVARRAALDACRKAAESVYGDPMEPSAEFAESLTRTWVLDGKDAALMRIGVALDIPD